MFLALGLIASYTFLYRCNFPDLKGDRNSLIYFAAIQDRTESAFVAEYEAVTDEAYRADMLRQIWRNSAILCEKYRAVAVAIRSSLATLLPFALFLTMTAIEHSRIPFLKI